MRRQPAELHKGRHNWFSSFQLRSDSCLHVLNALQSAETSQGHARVKGVTIAHAWRHDATCDGSGSGSIIRKRLAHVTHGSDVKVSRLVETVNTLIEWQMSVEVDIQALNSCEAFDGSIGCLDCVKSNFDVGSAIRVGLCNWRFDLVGDESMRVRHIWRSARQLTHAWHSKSHNLRIVTPSAKFPKRRPRTNAWRYYRESL